MAAEHRALPARPWDRGKVGASVPGAMLKPHPPSHQPSQHPRGGSPSDPAGSLRDLAHAGVPLQPHCPSCSPAGSHVRGGVPHTEGRPQQCPGNPVGSQPAFSAHANTTQAWGWQAPPRLAQSSGSSFATSPQPSTLGLEAGPPSHSNCLQPAGQATVQLGAESQPSGPSLPSKEPLRSCATGGKRCLEDPKK